MVYDPNRHEPLNGAAWSEAMAREAITEIVAEATSAFSIETLYPTHPREDSEKPNMGSGYYLGAGGVLWALDWLQRNAAAEVDEKWLTDSLLSLVDRFPQEAAPRGALAETVSFLFGDLPVLLRLLALTGDNTWRDLALQRLQQSTRDPVREMMWGTPGVLILTRLVDDPTLAEAAATVDNTNLDRLADAWHHKFENVVVWAEELYGSHPVLLGAVHGFFGQVLPFLQRLDDLDESRRNTVLERTRDVLLKTAMRDSDLVNWPVKLTSAGETGRPHVVHYCHGAPGVVISACDFPADTDPEVDAVLVSGGNLIWKAGPLAKGANLCHGTGGNGYAFLKLFARTGDSLWLDRARQFAMHGISQYRQERAAVGRDRFSLWTGDTGFAIYLWACITADARFPTVDMF